jgi:hypothetical protein
VLLEEAKTVKRGKGECSRKRSANLASNCQMHHRRRVVGVAFNTVILVWSALAYHNAARGSSALVAATIFIQQLGTTLSACGLDVNSRTHSMTLCVRYSPLVGGVGGGFWGWQWFEFWGVGRGETQVLLAIAKTCQVGSSHPELRQIYAFQKTNPEPVMVSKSQ